MFNGAAQGEMAPTQGYRIRPLACAVGRMAETAGKG